ncbi:MAG: hypothetical protein ACI93N_001037, partial [Flavobacteriaceae bacterium]
MNKSSYKNKNITIITPYFPSESNEYGGIFIFDQVIAMSNLAKRIDVFVTRPLFYISRKVPFIKFDRSNSIFKKTNKTNTSVVDIKYFPFPKDSLLYHKSIALSLWMRKYKFSKNILVHTVYPLGAAA